MPSHAFEPILEAIAFASRAHVGQLRKDKATPYASHVCRVAFIARHVFGVADDRVLTAAVLHDTVEDTTTDFDDLAEKFGTDVAQWVALLSKDKRLPEPEREREYVDRLRTAPWQVKVCKLADILDNFLDSSPQQRPKSVSNAKRYLKALADDLPEQARAPFDLVSKTISTAQVTF